MSPTLTDQPRSRVMAIDMTRGFALLAMCVSHMGELIEARFPIPGQVMHILGWWRPRPSC